MKTEAAISFIDSMDVHKHILLLYEDEEHARLIEFRFLKNGLLKGDYCMYVTDEDSGAIVVRMLAYGIPLKYFQTKQLQVIHIEERFGGKKEILDSCKKDIAKILSDLKKPFRIVSRIVPNVNTENGISVELQLEQDTNRIFDELGGSIMCPYEVAKIEKNKRKQWLEELQKNHHYVIYMPKSGDAGVFFED